MPQLCYQTSIPRHLHTTTATPRCLTPSTKTPLHAQPRPSSTASARSQQRLSPSASRAQGQEAEPLVSAAHSFFSSPFQQALSQALERSPEMMEEISAHVVSSTPPPAAPSALSFTAPKPSVPSFTAPKLPPPPAPSAQEDMLSAALEASKTSLSRLMAIRNEVERAIEREKMQVERLEFAVDKAQKDEAYYRVLRVIQDRGASDLDE